MNILSDQSGPRVVVDRAVAHALRGVELVLNWRGWTQGTLVMDPGGPCCLFGAALIAVLGPDGVGAWSDCDLSDDNDQAMIDAVCHFLVGAFDPGWTSARYSDVEFWNDDEKRTFDEVLAVVREAYRLAGGTTPEPVDLHTDLHPQPGDEPAAAVPADVEGISLGRWSS